MPGADGDDVERAADRRLDRQRLADRADRDRPVEADREPGADRRDVAGQRGRGDADGRRVTGQEDGSGGLGHRPAARAEGAGTDRDRVVGAGLPARGGIDRHPCAGRVPGQADAGRRLDVERRGDARLVHRPAERELDRGVELLARGDRRRERGLAERHDRRQRLGRRRPRWADQAQRAQRHESADSHRETDPRGRRSAQQDRDVEHREDGHGKQQRPRAFAIDSLLARFAGGRHSIVGLSGRSGLIPGAGRRLARVATAGQTSPRIRSSRLSLLLAGRRGAVASRPAGR